MLLSAAFPVGLWRVRGRLHQSLYLKSGNHGNCTVLMYESNKKDERTSELVENQPLTGRDMTVFVFETKKEGRASENLPETENRVMNRSRSELPLGLLRSFDFLFFSVLFYFTLLFRSLAESDCQHHNYFSVHALVYIEYCADLHNTWSSVETTAVCYC